MWLGVDGVFVSTRIQPSFKSHQQSLNDGVSVLALIVDHFDVVQVGISPVNQPVDQVQGDTMGEDNLTVHQLRAVLTIHVTALHPWGGPIVCEEHFAVVKEEKQKGQGSSDEGEETKREFH